MFQTRRSLISTFALLVGGLALGGASGASAQELSTEAQGFTLASYRGEYAVVGTYGANVARLIGTYWADGHGHAKGTAVVNLPGLSPERVVANISFEGSYTVNENGTGIFRFTVALPGGGTSNVTLDAVITKAEDLHGTKIATEIFDAQREPSSVVNGEFVTHVSTRLSGHHRRDRD